MIMKKRIIQIALVCLFVTVMFSCITQRSLFFTRQAFINRSNNSIESDDQFVLRIAPSVLNLEKKELTFGEDLLSKNMRKYVSTILQECHSSQDTLIAVSKDFIVLKCAKTAQELDANYIYNFCFDTGRWICSYVDAIAKDIPFIDKPCIFFRKVYVVKRKNRMIVKDYFKDFSIIYVIQGKNRKTDFYTTSVWNPSDFPTLITTTNYIRERIDPISYDIAKNKCFNSTDKL